MSEHTPGPWKVIDEQNSEWAYIDNRDESINICQVPEQDESYMLNAKLIAAAPDLLAACKIVLDNINIHHNFTHLRETMESAINKATE